MKRTTEKIMKMTGIEMMYDGNDHTENLSDYAGCLAQYADMVKGSDVFVKGRTFDNHLKANPKDIKILSFSNRDGSLICYVLLYKGSLSPLLISGVYA
jgi:hypothetical protein